MRRDRSQAGIIRGACILSGLLAVTAVGGCDITATNFPIHEENGSEVSDKVAGNVRVVQLSAENVDTYGAPLELSKGSTTLPKGGSWVYHVGPGDILDIVIWDHPELTMPSGTARTPVDGGLLVQPDGTFFYPYVGQVRAAGRVTTDIRAELAERLKEYISLPQVDVKVVGFNSQATSVTGEVGHPARIPLTTEAITLLDAINEAGGLVETSDAHNVSVRRGRNIYKVDLQAFLDHGIASNNPVLRDGDIVSVPRADKAEAYLLGQVAKPAPIDLRHDKISLTAAITTNGGLVESVADARGAFVFRNTAVGMIVYQLPISNAAAYAVGTRFYLHPKDVVYITPAPIAKWNRVISNLLPSVTTLRATETLGN